MGIGCLGGIGAPYLVGLKIPRFYMQARGTLPPRLITTSEKCPYSIIKGNPSEVTHRLLYPRAFLMSS